MGDQVLINSWLVMVTAGVLCGSAVSLASLMKKLGPWKAVFVVLVLAWGALFGAHLGHRLLFREFYRARQIPLTIIPTHGHTLLGAMAFDATLLLAISRIVPGTRFWATADAFALGTPSGLILARLGCYLQGCCWGTAIPAEHPMHGLSFRLVNNDLVAVHPTQLYSAWSSFVILVLLMLLHRKGPAPGTLALTFVVLYSAARFLLEFFRGDVPVHHPFLGSLSWHQGLCLVMFTGAAALLRRRLLTSRIPGSTRGSAADGRFPPAS